MSSDTLTVTSRNFLERTKAKLGQSIIVASAALMLLGFCAIAGGESQSADESSSVSNIDDHTEAAFDAKASGYGE